MVASRLYLIGFTLMVLGFVLVLAGGVGSQSTSIGGVVFIGPVPIVFGTGPGSGMLALISLLAGVVMVILVYLMYAFGRQRRSDNA